MNLEQVCQTVYTEVPGALAVAVVDLHIGAPIYVYHTVSHFNQDYVDLVSAAAVDLFRGRTVRMIENKLTGTRGRSARHAIKEVQMTTDHTLHFMMILPEKNNILALLVTNRSASIGMGWASLRRAIPKLTRYCP
ncbi:hypothetical protein [Conchiformibius kuhniae]|uniref:Roadblock/LC7 domain-containing protein n=1 Tax=Conchiformibius kuhniae TaxID=211502 RepID=A0A8T9MQ89_9NEIS|nr:hypothetical protein [Conchiformibius kuhniae]UOP04060.1 hypothetical protein LVJ77_06110 [Conchiformibius kuhniae]